MSLLFRIWYCAHRISWRLRDAALRRFTPTGRALLGALLVAAILGVDTENTVAYQGFALLFFLLLVAVPFAWPVRARLAVSRRLPRFGTAGNPFRYRIEVRNLTPRWQRGLVLREDLADTRPSFPDWRAAQRARQRRLRSFRLAARPRPDPFRPATVKAAVVPPLPPHEAAEVSVEITPFRRGLLRLAGLTLARSDPLGLVWGFARMPLPERVLILPRRYPLPPIALPGLTQYQPGGVALAARVGQSEEFVALRDYRRGDPLRHIHWRSWAKVDRPIVKEFEDEFFVRHALVLDTFTREPGSAAFEEAVSVAASFACTVPTQESLLDLLFVGPEAFCFTAGRGLAHADQMLEILAAVRPCRDKPFAALEHLVLGHVAVVSGCICVLLAWNAERRAFVEKLKRLGLPVLVLVIREPGSEKQLDPGPLRDDPNQLRALEVGRIEADLATLA